jgi:uncharacterized protein DUF1236
MKRPFERRVNTDDRRQQEGLVMFRCGTFAFVLVIGLSSGVALAQTPPAPLATPDDAIMHPPGHPSSPSMSSPTSQLQLTTAQKTTILNAVRRDSKGASPINFVVALGAPVPPSIELYILPDGALAAVPEAKMMKYTTVQNQVVLVDPTTMRVVDVIRE